MGRSRAWTYVLRIVESERISTPMEWRVGKRYSVPGYGKPTVENLAKWVAAYEKSLLPGGVNQHLSYGANKIDKVLSASITNQRTGEVVAEWTCTPVAA